MSVIRLHSLRWIDAFTALIELFFLEQTNNEKDLLQKSVDALGEEHKSESEKLKEELKRKLQTAAEQYEAKLQVEINKGIKRNGLHSPK